MDTPKTSLLPACPACGCTKTHDQGLLPRFAEQTFGGVASAVALPVGHLLWCPQCDLRFRYPYIDQDALNRLYEQLPVTTWQEHDRLVWGNVRALTERYNANDVVLDYGCFSGDFLVSLGGSWRKLGVELNRDARQLAASRGVAVVGATADAVAAAPKSVGVLTMLDVIEHLGDPLRVLQQLRELLVQNGSIIVLTGATDSVAWRFFGRHYWYSSLPEHVTFYSLKWFRWAASQLGMTVVWHGHVRYERPSPSQWLKRGARLSLYVATQQLRAAGLPEQWLRRLPLIGRAANWRSTPWWMGAKDHILVVLKASDG